MVIDDACRLEKRINNHGTGESAAPLFQIGAYFSDKGELAGKASLSCR